MKSPRILNRCVISSVLLSLTAGTALAATAPSEKVVPMKGKYVTVEFPASDLKVLNNPKEFMHFMDEVYANMQELTDNSPTVIIRVGKVPNGVWGYASADGVRIGPGAFTDVLKKFNRGSIEFGIIHETGHVFDARNKPRWYICPGSGGEEMANLKLAFVVDRLLRPDNHYRIDFGPGGLQTGRHFDDHFFLKAGAKYLADPSKDWTKMSSDELISFHIGIAQRFGWDVLKKWFRTYPVMESMGFWAPPKVDDPQRMIVECAIFTHFTGANLMPYFEKYRLPVTQAAMDEAVKHYRLNEAFKVVEAQYKKEVAEKKITPDPKGWNPAE